MGKRAINWVEIKARYLAGERPVDIAKDYRSCTAYKISQKAHKEGWKQEKEKISENIAQFVEDESKKLALRVIAEYEKIAFANMKDFSTWGPDGVKLVSSSRLTPELSACVAEVSETITKDGGSTKFKLHNKMSALDSLAKYLGLFKERDEAPEKSGEGVNITLNIKRQSGQPAAENEKSE